MAKAIQIRMGGYGPASTGFSKALKFIGERLESRFGDRVEVKYVWNIMDFGYRAEDILWLGEKGPLTPRYPTPALSPRPRGGAGLRRPAVPVLAPRYRAIGHRRQARTIPRRQDRGPRE